MRLAGEPPPSPPHRWKVRERRVFWGLTPAFAFGAARLPFPARTTAAAPTRLGRPILCVVTWRLFGFLVCRPGPPSTHLADRLTGS